MDRHSVNWSGPMPAVVTPFDASGNVDEAAFAENLQILLKKGATGFVVGGCTGEFWAMTLEERKNLYKLGAKAVAGKGTLIAGTGAITVRDTVELSNAAQEAGADGALILPPYFVKLTDDEIFAHYEAVSSQVSLPIMLYNIPGNAVNGLSPHLVDRLSSLDKVVAVKESSGDWNNYYATAIAVQSKLRVFCGPSSVFGVSAVLLGADGIIDCFPNVWAPGGLDLYYAAKEGRLEEARDLQELGRRLTDLFVSEGRTLYPSTKAAMQLLGLPGGELRAPLKPLGQRELDGLARGLAALGLLPQAKIERLSA
ncbi:dihydrodipicolinate synthase family protein [Microvirga antarctica]|uniref:dihydrodipicolinate synthase family protein n=1 Tax=Microvirga antarctica TaxID=2819233 RepID=UPI001B3116C3|nr:dihydrodipicolinate synthase family protein [Microvirga antarctica]